jgi:hypothetical protein
MSGIEVPRSGRFVRKNPVAFAAFEAASNRGGGCHGCKRGECDGVKSQYQIPPAEKRNHPSFTLSETHDAHYL